MRLRKYKDKAEVCNLHSRYFTPLSGLLVRLASDVSESGKQAINVLEFCLPWWDELWILLMS